MIKSKNRIIKKLLAKLIIVMAILCFAQSELIAQEQPPRPIAIYVSPVQNLSFGAIILGPTGGDVIINPNGSRGSTGDIVLADFGFTYSSALIEIEANPGTLVTILNGPDALLTGSNGGTMSMHIGNSDPTSPFVTTAAYPTRTYVRIGGVLTIGSSIANPAGAYSGSFQVTFIQE